MQVLYDFFRMPNKIGANNSLRAIAGNTSHINYLFPIHVTEIASTVYNKKKFSFKTKVGDVLLCFCHFPMWCPRSGLVLDYIDF